MPKQMSCVDQEISGQKIDNIQSHPSILPFADAIVTARVAGIKTQFMIDSGLLVNAWYHEQLFF